MEKEKQQAAEFLPVTGREMRARGWEAVDFVYVIGDAYVDHPSFGPAILSRLLESHGYRVGIIAQPDWKRSQSVQIFGEPRLGFLVSAGNMDSMVNHYTVSKKRRSKDLYSPGGKMGLRPDRAAVVYGNLIRQSYPHSPIILGGIEASLRRLAHYDYWENKIRRSVLLDGSADLISYGMGEHSLLEIAQALREGIPISQVTFVPGTVYRTKELLAGYEIVELPSYESLLADPMAYAKSFRTQYENTDPFRGKVLAESYGKQGYLVQNPPAKPLSTQEMDDIYALPYKRRAHPMYEALGGIPAFSEVKFSLASSRGCFGGCNFCALTFHQGRILQVRSHESLLKEAGELTKEPDFKGYIHDVGGPTADFRQPSCKKQLTSGVCPKKQCLVPTPCKNLIVSHRDYIELLDKLRAVPGVKQVFIRSGVRFDYVAVDPDKTFLQRLARYHISGQLRVAPEHVSDRVLACMGKPGHAVYRQFLEEFQRENDRCQKKQYVVPYFMSSHPGSTMAEAVKLAEYVRDMGFMPEQVQDFYPTPSTVSTCMYYTGVHPLTMEKVYVPKNPHEKAIQRALLQYRLPQNRALVKEGLLLAHREDLIGYDRRCLLRPDGHKVHQKTESARKLPTKKKKTIRNIHQKKKGGPKI